MGCFKWPANHKPDREAEHVRMGRHVSSPHQAKMTAKVQGNTTYAEAQERAGTTTLGEATFQKSMKSMYIYTSVTAS